MRSFALDVGMPSLSAGASAGAGAGVGAGAGGHVAVQSCRACGWLGAG